MRYAVEIDRSSEAVSECLNRVKRNVETIDEWIVTVNAGGIDYGVYFNFDTIEQELIICNQPLYGYDESLYLDEIIDVINEESEEEEDE